MAASIKEIRQLGPQRIKDMTEKQAKDALKLYDKLFNGRCKHGHRYISHLNCYREEMGYQERIGYLDIEASNLCANFGIMLTWCIYDPDKDLVHYDRISKEDLNGDMDKRITQSCIDSMCQFDRIVHHFGMYYDVPFIRTRALIHGLDFPTPGQIVQTDVWKMAKRLLKLHSNRQDVIAESLFKDNIKTRIKNEYWIKALQGDKTSIDYVLHHNEMDVYQLYDNYQALTRYWKHSNISV